MFENHYELPLSADYVQSWGVVQAIREIVQNCLDSDSPFEWAVTKEENDTFTLTLSSRFSGLTPAHLILGSSSKSENDGQIGQFGEGFKLAMLVLTRDGHEVIIENNGYVWLPLFKFSKKFESEILQVKSIKNPCEPNGLNFIIRDLTEEQMQEVYRSNLHMRDYPQHKETAWGNILLDDPAKLYVNGLFVCDIEAEHGYDIKPEHLKLDRDRRSVPSFDLHWTIANMWRDTGEFGLIAEKMEAESPDMKGMEWNDTALVKEACYKRFVAKHGENTMAISSQKELDELAEEGIVNTVYVGGSYGVAIRGSSGYRSSPVVQHRKKTPHEALEEYFKANRQYMRTKAIVAIKKIIDQSKEWKLK